MVSVRSSRIATVPESYWIAAPAIAPDGSLAGVLEVDEPGFRVQIRCTRTRSVGWSDLWSMQVICGYRGVTVDRLLVAINHRDRVASVLSESNGSEEDHDRRQSYADALRNAMHVHEAQMPPSAA